MTWWYWAVFGLALVAIEMATPSGFFVIFFGLSAILVGFLRYMELAGPAWMQWLLFAVFAVCGLTFFREPLFKKMRAAERPDQVDSLIGEVAIATSDIPPGGHGRAELRGSSWNAHNVGTTAIALGQRCHVAAVNGLVLNIRQE